MKITLTHIKIENFKGIATLDCDIDETRQEFHAENGGGKTSIKNAIEWTLCQNVGDYVPAINNKEIDDITTSVELTINKDDIIYTFKRVSKPEYKTNAEDGSRTKKGNTSIYYIDDMKYDTQKKYLERVLTEFEMPNEEVFAMLLNKDYFNTDNGTKWNWQTRRKLLLGMIDIKKIHGELLESDTDPYIVNSIKKGYSTTDIRKILERKQKEATESRKRTLILIEQREADIAELNKTDFNAVEEEIKTKNATLDKLIKSSKKEAQNAEISALTDEISKLSNKANKLKNADTVKMSGFMTAKNMLYREALLESGKLSSLSLDIKSKTDEIETWQGRLDSVETVCPTCGQPMPEDKVKTSKKNIRATIKTLKSELAAKEEAYEQQSAVYAAKKAEYEAAEKSASEFVANPEIAEIEKQIAEKMAIVSSKKSTVLNERIVEQERELQIEISNLTKQLSGKDTIEKYKRDIARLKDELKTISDDVVEAERILSVLKEFVKHQVTLIEEAVNQKFTDGITFSLFDTTYNGGYPEIKENCRVMLNGKIYSDLSTGEKILVNIRIAEQLQNYYGVNVFITVDNNEALTYPIESTRQLIGFYATPLASIDGMTKIDDIYNI